MTREKLENVLSRFEDGWFVTIQCESGWDDLIADLDRELSSIDPSYVVHQVKEKFGGLRFYFATNTNKRGEMNEVVKRYEDLSLRTCELSGKPGVLMHKNGFYRTLSPEEAPEGFAPVDDLIV